MGQRPVSITLVILPEFPLHGLALCVDALRVANRQTMRPAFDWTIATADGRATRSSAGIPVEPQLGLDQIEISPVSIVLAAYDPERAATDALLRWLRRQDRRGGALGCVDTGAWLLATAGVLRGDPTCVHADAVAGLREEFPGLDFLGSGFRFATRRFSSAGGMATLDMMLALIAHHEGAALAQQVGAMLNHRPPPDPAPPASGIVGPHPILGRCLDLMQTHIEEPLSLDQLGTLSGAPAWTIRRLFQRQLGTTPMAHYRQLRLDRGRQLLAYSHLSVGEIALACGFTETASFTRAVRDRFGRPPSRLRRDASGLPDTAPGSGI